MPKKHYEGQAVAIRSAGRRDAVRIAKLSTQLGYPSSQEEIGRRLRSIGRERDHAVFVAVGSRGRVLGWVHVFASLLVESDPHAEIGGLVVDEAYRDSGVGRLLMARAERWVYEKGLKTVYLRSNVIRKGAHAFYKRLGYTMVKTQHAFRKVL